MNGPVLNAVGLGALTVLLGTPPGGLQRFSYAHRLMGTRFEIVLYCADAKLAQAGSEAAFRRVSDLDGIMSDYRPTSELMRLCHSAGRGASSDIPLSPDLCAILSQAQEIAAASGGAFDVTIGPLSRLWRQARRTHEPPSDAEVAKARTLVGYAALHIDKSKRSARLDLQGMMLDLGGIGKGYAADEALGALARFGIRTALVAAGGDLAAGEPPPGTEGWRVAVPALGGGVDGVLVLRNAAISTSGDLEQALTIEGKRYSHILDPRVGIPLTRRRLVTVIAPQGLRADPLTKVISVLGPVEGAKVLRSFRGASWRCCEEKAKGEVDCVTSPEFPKLMPLVPPSAP